MGFNSGFKGLICRFQTTEQKKVRAS